MHKDSYYEYIYKTFKTSDIGKVITDLSISIHFQFVITTLITYKHCCYQSESIINSNIQRHYNALFCLKPKNI